VHLLDAKITNLLNYLPLKLCYTSTKPMMSLQAKTVHQFLQELQKDSRYRVEPLRYGHVKLVQVNLEKLRVRLEDMLYRSFQFWDHLDDYIRREWDAFDDGPLPNPVKEGCRALSVLMVRQLYSLLARKARRILGYSHPKTARYGHREELLEEIPDGCAYLVEQFGVSELIQAPGNYTVLHVWDGEYPDTLGISPTVHEETEYGAYSFFCALRAAGVTMRKIDLECPERSLWDSLSIGKEQHGGYCISTTFPIQHYNLPRDAFLAYCLCREQDGEAEAAIESYSRLVGSGEDPPSDLGTKESDDQKAGSGKRKRNTDDTEEIKKKSIPRICSVVRGVDEGDVFHYFRLLFRHGPN
jgi:hypothetical protein